MNIADATTTRLSETSAIAPPSTVAPTRWLRDLAAAAKGMDARGGNAADAEVSNALRTRPAQRSSKELAALAGWLERGAALPPSVMKHLDVDALCRAMVLRPSAEDGQVLRYQGDRSEALLLVLSGRCAEYGAAEDPADLAIHFSASAIGGGSGGGSSGGGGGEGGSELRSAPATAPLAEARASVLRQLHRFRHKEAVRTMTDV